MAASPRLRAAVVGAGHMGAYHALAYAELPEVDLVGVADLDPDRARTVAQHYDVAAFTDHRHLIGRADVVSVAVPTEEHFPVARDLLQAGVHVLVDRKSTRLNSSHIQKSRMPSSA